MGDGGVSIEEGESEASVTGLPPSRRWIQSWMEASSRMEPPWPSITKLAFTRSLSWLAVMPGWAGGLGSGRLRRGRGRGRFLLDVVVYDFEARDGLLEEEYSI